MSSLRENAAVLAGRVEEPPDFAGFTAPAPAVELPDLGIPEPDEGGPEQVPVHVAWLRVRRDVGAVRKDDVFTGGTRYNFRGIDRVLNAFGPATLRHGVNVLPVKVETSYRDTRSSNDKPTRECTVLVTYRIYGPTGDFFEVQSAGESLDVGDKGTPKALSTALRSLLLLGGLIPSTDPDPELSTIERGEAPVRSPASYAEEILSPSTSPGRMQQISQELAAHRQGNALVMNELGQEEPVRAMCIRIGNQRFAPQAAPARKCDRCDGPHHPDACPSLNGGPQ